MPQATLAIPASSCNEVQDERMLGLLSPYPPLTGVARRSP